MTDLLVYWTQTAANDARARARHRGHQTTPSAATPTPTAVKMPASESSAGLPEPIFPEAVAAAHGRRAACYTLSHASVVPGAVASTNSTISNTSAARAFAVPANAFLSWRTATCTPAPASTAAAANDTRGPAELVAPGRAAGLIAHRSCVRRVRAMINDKDASQEAVFFDAHSPRTACERTARGASGPLWTFCKAHGGKISPAVSASTPGALLWLELPTAWLPARQVDRQATGRADGVEIGGAVEFNVTLQHLVSWHSMGKVRIACHGACGCAAHTLDASAVSSLRNVTVFREHRFIIRHHHAVREAAREAAREVEVHVGDARDGYQVSRGSRTAGTSACEVTLEVLEETSSGGHLFRVRDLLLFVAESPCVPGGVRYGTSADRMTASDLKMMSRRSGINCADGGATT